MEDVVLTKVSMEKLKQELNILKTVKRKEVIQALKEARAHGDLSENAEYDAAREEQAHVEARIAKLEEKLGNARIIDTEKMPKDAIRFGAKVQLKDCKTKEEEVFILVCAEEADYLENKISIYSPIAQGLMGHKKGEIVEVTVPAGVLKYEVLDISFEE
ncbi:transcription elongation factor GreA [Candidatus Poribacteria bacterium]|nr:transcription elongation factor GreA [Candidatus Poribacteria bacterium]